MSYYQRNRAVLIERQIKYHQANREKYLAYMREYNKKYYLAHKPPPKPKKEKKIKPVKEPKPPKKPKKTKSQEELKEKEAKHWFRPIEPTPLKVEIGCFILSFD